MVASKATPPRFMAICGSSTLKRLGFVAPPYMLWGMSSKAAVTHTRGRAPTGRHDPLGGVSLLVPAKDGRE